MNTSEIIGYNSDLIKELPKIPPAESMLRTHTISALEMLNGNRQQVINLLDPYNVQLSKTDGLIDTLVEGITNAQRNIQHWGAEEKIKIGYYQNPEEYFTVLFHEAGHYGLSRHSRIANQSIMPLEEEEKFCWHFSKAVCSITNLPYSKGMEEYQKSIFQLLQGLANNRGSLELQEEYDRLLLEGERRYGYSELAKDTQIEWSPDGIPKVVELIKV